MTVLKSESNQSEASPSYIPSFLKLLFAISVILAFIVIGLYFYHFNSIFSVAQDAWGQLGDYIGGLLNPLFSFTALCALFYTIKLQSKELHESTEQLKNSAAALALQNEVLVTQRFETTFFQLFELFNQLIRTMSGTINNHIYYSKVFISEFYSNSVQCYQLEQEISAIKTLLHAEPQFGAYFRTLYSIIKFIDNNTLDYADKKFYANLVRAQLSNAELALLFYSCLFMPDYEKSKFIPLIIRYDVLEYLTDETLANPQHRQLWQ